MPARPEGGEPDLKYKDTGSTRLGGTSVSRSVRALSTDLVAIVGFLAVLNVVLRVSGLQELTVFGARIQILIAIPALLFVPGYVLVAVFFPGRSDRDVENREIGESDVPRSIDLVERAALSFGMSLALIPIFAVFLGSLWGFSRPVVLTTLTVAVLVGIAIAAIRRLLLPPEARYSIPVRRWGRELRLGIFQSDDRVDRIGTLVLLLAVLAAVGAMGFAVATPYQSGGSSTLYLVTENETGAWTASGYPTEFTAGEAQALAVAIENHEDDRQMFTVVITVERVQTGGTEASVIESREIDRRHPTVPAGATWIRQHAVAPEMIGEDLRLHYYLYKGDSGPADPDSSSAYRDVYLWINVTES